MPVTADRLPAKSSQRRQASASYFIHQITMPVPVDYEQTWSILDDPSFFDSIPPIAFVELTSNYFHTSSRGNPMVKGLLTHEGHRIKTLVFGDKEEEAFYKMLIPGDVLMVRSIRRSTNVAYRNDLVSLAFPWAEQEISTLTRIHAVMHPTPRMADAEPDPIPAEADVPRRKQLELPVRHQEPPVAEPCIQHGGLIELGQRRPRRKLTLALRDDQFSFLDASARPDETRQEVIRRILDQMAEEAGFDHFQKRA